MLRLPTWKTALVRSAPAPASSSAALALSYAPFRGLSRRWTPSLITALSFAQEYEDPAHAAEAVAKYNEGHFLGSQIKVELSLARTDLPKDSESPWAKGAFSSIPDAESSRLAAAQGTAG